MYVGEGWHSGESARLPPVWPVFNSRIDYHHHHHCHQWWRRRHHHRHCRHHHHHHHHHPHVWFA